MDCELNFLIFPESLNPSGSQSGNGVLTGDSLTDFLAYDVPIGLFFCIKAKEQIV
jgi:hypothetical protein